MEEILAEGFFKPVLRLLLGFLRILQFLAWDLFVSCVGWSVGWFFLRLITVGKFPSERLGDQHVCSFVKAMFVEFIGLAVIGGSIFMLMKLI